MTSAAVVSAFCERLNIWQSKDACPLIAENAGGLTPKDGSPFLFMQFPVVMREQITFGAPGANVFRESGACRLVIHVERGSSLAQGRAWTDELARLFLGRDLGGVFVQAIDGPATDDRSDNGNYFRLSLAIAYDFDFTA